MTNIPTYGIIYELKGQNKMSERLYEFIVTGTCVAIIVAGAIFGTWALMVTMSW